MSIEAILATILALQILCSIYLAALIYRLNKDWTRHVKRMEALVYELATGKEAPSLKRLREGNGYGVNSGSTKGK